MDARIGRLAEYRTSDNQQEYFRQSYGTQISWTGHPINFKGTSQHSDLCQTQGVRRKNSIGRLTRTESIVSDVRQV